MYILKGFVLSILHNIFIVFPLKTDRKHEKMDSKEAWM